MRDKFKTNELLSMYPSRKAITLASAAVLALGLLFTLSSCSGDLLQTEDPNRVTPDNFW